jgi:two-component system, cell cycle sensor histidine kinase and response regulator CckA
MVEDVSERKQLEDQLLHSQKMEAIGRLAGGIAHDFNNLLLVITGYGETVLSAMDGDDPLRFEIGQMTHAAERAASLTGQLLALSRKQMLQPTQVDLNAVVAETEAMLRRLIGEDIELETLPAPDLAVVRADPGQVAQVLLNLAVNARDAMPDGGKLAIATANVTLDRPAVHEHFSIQPGRYATVAVSDTGHGIDPELQARVFDPFFTTKEQGRGTGLGLATVYGIVKQSGGYISVDSAPERGTTFTVYLPQEPAATTRSQPCAAAPAVLPPDARTGGTSVLVVEDEPAVRSLVRELLARDGYTVLEAAGPDEALAIFDRDAATIDVVLSDVVMPGMAGPELASLLIERRPSLKVIYMSGYTDDALDRRGVREAGVAFLQKPFTRDTLSRAVRDALEAA